MKNITIDERIAKLDEERERLYNVKDVIEVLEREQKWLREVVNDIDGRYMIYEELIQYLLK